MRTGGMPFSRIGQALGVTGPTAKAWVEEANTRMKARTLFTDIDSESDMDLYQRTSIERRA